MQSPSGIGKVDSDAGVLAVLTTELRALVHHVTASGKRLNTDRAEAYVLLYNKKSPWRKQRFGVITDLRLHRTPIFLYPTQVLYPVKYCMKPELPAVRYRSGPKKRFLFRYLRIGYVAKSQKQKLVKNRACSIRL